MKFQLLFQKVYFKAREWKEFLSFINLKYNRLVFLLSKNIFLDSFKQVKNNFLGECVVIHFDEDEKSFFSSLNDFLLKIKNKYGQRFFLIGFLLESNNQMNFLTIEQLRYYTIFYKQKRIETSLVGLHSLLVFNFLKQLKLQEVQVSICQSFFKTSMPITNYNFSFYY